MTKDGMLSKREMETLNKAWTILSRWTEKMEEQDADTTYEYDSAMNAVCGLCEFINGYSEIVSSL